MPMNIERTLSISDLSISAFLFGCRQSGKTWLLQHTLQPDLYIDLLDHANLLRYTAQPDLLYAEVEALGCHAPLVVIDEIQKVPGMLDEVQRVIQSDSKARFILTGSSARKLKRNHANMLGGRAITLKLYPLSCNELGEMFDLSSYLQYGGLPPVALTDDVRGKQQILNSYVATYLKEEIIDEALVRNLPAFSRFLELAGHESGNILNYTAISNQLGVASVTVKEYFQILEDSLLGFFLPAWRKAHRRRLVKRPKFYLSDPGIVFALRKMLTMELSEASPIYGDAFEHFIILETIKAIAYLEEEITPYYFLTADGAEVDLILEQHGQCVAIEIKSSTRPSRPSGLLSFMKDHHVVQSYCVCRTPRAYVDAGIMFLPWKDYISRLYDRCVFG